MLIYANSPHTQTMTEIRQNPIVKIKHKIFPVKYWTVWQPKKSQAVSNANNSVGQRQTIIIRC